MDVLDNLPQVDSHFECWHLALWARLIEDATIWHQQQQLPGGVPTNLCGESLVKYYVSHLEAEFAADKHRGKLMEFRALRQGAHSPKAYLRALCTIWSNLWRSCFHTMQCRRNSSMGCMSLSAYVYSTRSSPGTWRIGMTFWTRWLSLPNAFGEISTSLWCPTKCHLNHWLPSHWPHELPHIIRQSKQKGPLQPPKDRGPGTTASTMWPMVPMILETVTS